MDEQKNTKIVKLEAENVKMIKAVSITPKGNLICIGGENGSGKTSTLDCIEYALNGGKSLPSRPLHDGAEEGYIVLETESLVIRRTFKEGSSNLEVRNKANQLKLGSPQAILDALSGDLTFDPLAFAKMKPKEQKVTLQKLIGLDFTQVDATKKDKFDSRTLVNREVKNLQGQLAGMAIIPDAPEKEVDVTELTQQLFAATQAKADYDRKKEEVNQIADKYTAVQERIENLKAELASSEAELAEIMKNGQAMKAEIEAFTPPDVTGIQSQIENANEINEGVKNNTEIAELNLKLDAKMHEADDLTEEILAIDEEKERQIHEALMPVEGLGFGDEGVTFNGVPFEQSSGAEEIRVSVAMGMALNPEMKIILIRDGSLLDDKSLAMVAEMAEAKGYFVWMERVGEGKECQVILEEGVVKEDRTDV